MALFDQVDKDGLLEYSVVFNDRSLNSMSKSFQGVMRDLSVGLKSAYNAEASILVQGGTFGMEAITPVWHRCQMSCHPQWMVLVPLV